MKHFKKHIIFIFLFGYLFSHNIYAQFDIPEKPNFQTSVYDYIGLLSKNEKQKLENKLIKYSDSTSTQIVVGIIKSTKGENISYLATNWAHKWGIGEKDKDNGIFILLANDDRKITIRTGYGTEHLLTDYISRQIIEYNIAPHFKNGNYYAGLDSATNSIFKVMSGEYKGTRKKDEGFPIEFIILLIVIIIFIILISRNNRNNNGGNYTNYNDFDPFILSHSGRRSYHGSGGFFGGDNDFGGFGGGFGGGGFGGGGATGDW